MEWIKCSERLPEKFLSVLLISNKGNYGISCVDASGELDSYPFLDDENITHWQPLPEPPKDNE